ncbi:hypothetical protein I3760_09G125900 [Carya illinoinensis]|nr:hypothetical protein I3760_09G125900 [Carya illinoinensis]
MAFEFFHTNLSSATEQQREYEYSQTHEESLDTPLLLDQQYGDIRTLYTAKKLEDSYHWSLRPRLASTFCGGNFSWRYQKSTNASFVLRKYYFSLLHHYEQIYFFKARGWVHISSNYLTSPTLTPVPIQRTESLQPTPEIQAAKDKYCRIGWRSIIDAEGILYAWTLLKRLGVLYAAAWFFLHGFDLISKSLEEGGEPGKKELLEGVLS